MKKVTSIGIDQKTLKEFGRVCDLIGVYKSTVIEDFMINYIKIYDGLTGPKVRHCAVCGKDYGKVSNCPHCRRGTKAG